MLFQRFPYRPPMLRGRFHHDFIDLAFDQTVRQATEIDRRRADLLTLEVEVAVNFNVRYRDGQYLLVDVYSRDPVRHRPPCGSGERASSHQSMSRAITGQEHGDAQLFGQSRTLQIKQLLGLACSIVAVAKSI